MSRGPGYRWRGVMGMGVLRASRVLERVLPPGVLRVVLLPVAVLLALREVLGERSVAVNPWGEVGAGRRFAGRVRMQLARYITNWPDRLGERRWRGRMRLVGEALDEAVAAGEAVILVTGHFGPLHLGGYWLRALGYPVATYVEDGLSIDLPSRRAKARCSGSPGMRQVFSAQDSLRAVQAWVRQGNILRMAFDVPVGRSVAVELAGGEYEFRTGALRLAASCGAKVVPYVISEDGPWRFSIHFCRPVPAGADVNAAARHVLAECSTIFARGAEQAGPLLLGAFAPERLEVAGR